MKKTIAMMQAPAQLSPGNYVRSAYASQVTPVVNKLNIDAQRSGDSWEIRLQWRCENPVTSLQGSTDRFVDAAAILVPTHEQSQWLTMGSAEAPVEGVLWRPDRSDLIRISAQGLGSVQRHAPAPTWRIKASHDNGIYTLHWLLPKWDPLNRFSRCGFALWNGAQQQRGGVKSVSTEWVTLS